jgi:hypothetical protein
MSPNKSHVRTYASGGGFTVTLTPNFATGFGPVASLMGSGGEAPSPAPGGTASLGAGDIDFGTVSPGIDYYYRYGMEIAITAPSSYELAAAISGNVALGVPANMLTWVTTDTAHYTDGVSTEETAYGGLPFGSDSAPLAVYSGKSGSTTLKYDYILTVPSNAQSGAGSAQITYTVIL